MPASVRHSAGATFQFCAAAATRIYGSQCLIARRLIERGARFIEITCPNVGHDRWDQHSNLKKGHEDNARATDKPVAGLLKDLKSRGLLESTLVIWGLVWTGSETAVPLVVLRDLAVWLLKAELVAALPIWVVARIVDLLAGGPPKRRGGRS